MPEKIVHRRAPGPCDQDAVHPNAPARRPREPWNQQRDGKIELHFERERPVHAVDRIEGPEPEIVRKRQMRRNLPQLVVLLMTRLVIPECLLRLAKVGVQLCDVGMKVEHVVDHRVDFVR